MAASLIGDRYRSLEPLQAWLKSYDDLDLSGWDFSAMAPLVKCK